MHNGLNIVLTIVSEDVLSSVIPKEVVVYSFWLSLGLYLGFQLYKYGYQRVIRKIWEEEHKEEKE
jgi:hypothetical protein